MVVVVVENAVAAVAEGVAAEDAAEAKIELVELVELVEHVVAAAVKEEAVVTETEQRLAMRDVG